MPIDPRMRNPRKSQSIWARYRRRGLGYPDVLQLRGSVLWSVLPVVLFSTAFTAVICALYILYDVEALNLPGSLIGSVAVVVGLLLAFRTNNAYDRYYEGRKLFSSMCTQIRNCARAVWIGIEESNDTDRAQKEQCLKLLLAYAVSTKHHLRLEFGTHWFDLEDLLPDGFQFTQFEGNADQTETSGDDPNDSNNQQAIPKRKAVHVRPPLRNAGGRLSPTFGYLGDGNDLDLIVQDWDDDVEASMSLPLEIVYNLGLMIDVKFRENKLDSSNFGFITGTMNCFIEILGNLERIGNTPIPHAYNIHLKQAVNLYVWTLPFTLVAELGWLTVPAVFLIAFVLFGVEGIGAEIENPFGYDRNDLPLDEYCKDLEGEIKYLQRHIPQKKAIGSIIE
jgi:putative membrane protein